MSVITDEIDITEEQDSGLIAPAGRHHALILVGGKGVRLRPYTTIIPKPLVPIADEHSILEIVLCQLARDGFTSATLAIGHLGQLIRAYVGDGSQWGIDVDYVQEASPLGTIGPALTVLDRLPDHFLLMNGDVLTDLDFGELLTEHIGSGAPVTVATYARSHRVDFGVLEVIGSQVTGFEEKPTLNYNVSMGVYAISKRHLERYSPGLPFGFDDLMLDLIERGNPPNSYHFDGFWLDIGRPDDYERANEEFTSRRPDLLPV
jgi:NDP-sugar pyrophosphorylase family protein